MNPSGPSRHPADELIRELIRARRAADAGELELIRGRMATAAFLSPASLSDHVMKRIADGQWMPGLSAQQFIELSRAVVARASRLALYRRRRGFLAAAVAETSEVVGRQQRGHEAAPLIVTVYSADRARLITTYQFGNDSDLAVPEDAVWLALPPPPTSTGHSTG